MTKSEIMKYAHAEARKMKNISYRQAMVFGLRRAYNKQMHLVMMAVHEDQPKFMWLRGM